MLNVPILFETGWRFNSEYPYRYPQRIAADSLKLFSSGRIKVSVDMERQAVRALRYE